MKDTIFNNVKRVKRPTSRSLGIEDLSYKRR